MEKYNRYELFKIERRKKSNREKMVEEILDILDEAECDIIDKINSRWLNFRLDIYKTFGWNVGGEIEIWNEVSDWFSYWIEFDSYERFKEMYDISYDDYEVLQNMLEYLIWNWFYKDKKDGKIKNRFPDYYEEDIYSTIFYFE